MAFEKQMSNVGTLLEGDVQGRLAELSKSVISISNATGAGTGDLTDGLYQVISAFGDTADSEKILETATKATGTKSLAWLPLAVSILPQYCPLHP